MNKFNWVETLMTFALAVIFILINVLAFMIIWNITMPALFGLPSLSYWNALCLKILADILFKSSITFNKKM